MECAVRRSVPAIRAAACGESPDGSDKYKRGRYSSARANNAKKVSHPQGCPDQHAHRASGRVPFALGFRTTSNAPDYCRKESHTGTTGDTYSANGQANAHCTEDPHSDHDHCYPADNTSN